MLILCMVTSEIYAQEQPTVKQWQDDLRYLQSTVHKDFPFLFKKVTAKDFDTAVDKLYSEIPSMEAHELPIGFARIVSLFQYGHTQIPFSKIAKNGILPINFYHFNDGIYIEGTTKEHEKTLGAKVLKIENTPINKALELVRPVVPVENDQYYKAYGIRFLGSPEVLHAQGVIANNADQVTLTLEKEGQTFEYTFPKINLKDKPKTFNFTLPTENWLTSRDTKTTPLYLKHFKDKLYFFEQLPDSKTVYVRQSSVFNDDNETLKDFYKRLFSYIDDNNIDKVIYDVRLNGGGNNYNNMPLIKGLMARPNINKKGNFFFIIGRDTFSACQNLTNEIGRYTEAIIVGEPTSENVNFYGDTKPVKLPNSGLTAYLSFAWWQDLPQWENKDATVPHLAKDISFNEYKTNQDPVLEVALNYTDDGFILNPMQHLTELFVTQNFAQLKKDAHKIAKNPEYKYYDFQKEFSKAGNRLVSQGSNEGGLFVFELLTEVYPDSGSAFYSLANLQEDMNLKDKAVASYKKIIKIDATSSLAKAAKNRLKELNKE